jgi:hypothetical protein
MEFPITSIISTEITIDGNIEIQTIEEEVTDFNHVHVIFVKSITTRINGIITQSTMYTKNLIIDDYKLESLIKHYPTGNSKEHWTYVDGVLTTQSHNDLTNTCIFSITLHPIRKYYNDPSTDFFGVRWFDINGNITVECVESFDDNNCGVEKTVRYVDMDNIWDGIPRINYYSWDFDREVDDEIEEPIDGPLWVLPDHDLYIFENFDDNLSA